MTSFQPNTLSGGDRTLSASPNSWRCFELSTLDQMVQILDRVETELKAHGYSERDCFGIRLSLEEAIANGIRHGNRNDPSKMVRVAYSIDSYRMVAEVEDQGPGFNPDALPDPVAPENLEKPSGRGVFLMRAYMSWVKYNDCGNRVTLCKTRQ